VRPLDWQINTHYSADHVGRRSLILDVDNPESAAIQLGKLGYPNAPPDLGWQMTADNCLLKEGAPLLPPAARAVHLGEQIFIYPGGYVSCVALDGSFKLFYVG